MTRDWLLTALTIASPYLAAALVAANLLVPDLLAWVNRRAGDGGRRAAAARRDAVLGATGGDAIAGQGDAARA